MHPIKCPKCKSTTIHETTDGIYVVYSMAWNKKEKQYEALWEKKDGNGDLTLECENGHSLDNKQDAYLNHTREYEPQETPTGKLTRDHVVSIVKGKDLVGVYWKGTDGSHVLLETSPEKADKIIKIFNEK